MRAQDDDRSRPHLASYASSPGVADYPEFRLLHRSAAFGCDLELMREIERPHSDYPFAGARMLRNLLRAEPLLH